MNPSNKLEYTVLMPVRFWAPRFILENRENHGRGYHSHLRVLKSGNYKRTGYLITINNKSAYAIEHGNSGNLLININKIKTKLVNEIYPAIIEDVFKGIAEKEMLPLIKKKAIKLFSF
ncbi:MAG: hypothetical protein KKG94_01140 [Nanoarchaeota archaeon]|nr:hypothetical protein [Nanoarchaeota archaeon]